MVEARKVLALRGNSNEITAVQQTPEEWARAEAEKELALLLNTNQNGEELAAQSQIFRSTTPPTRNDVLGLWKVDVGEDGSYAYVDLQPCSNEICGTLIDVYNRYDERLGNNPNRGKKIVWGMSAVGNGQWSGGRVWSPDTEVLYRSRMTLEGNILQVSGCLPTGHNCRTTNWIPVE